jgi:nucleoid-associated protein YgaU
VLVLKDQIHLYAEFEKLQNLQEGGYLRGYIEKLEQQNMPRTAQTATTKAASPASTDNQPVVMAAPATTSQTTASRLQENTGNKANTVTMPQAMDTSATTVEPTSQTPEARQKASHSLSTKQVKQAALATKKDTRVVSEPAPTPAAVPAGLQDKPLNTPGKNTAPTGSVALTRAAAQTAPAQTISSSEPNKQPPQQADEQAGGLFALLAVIVVIVSAAYAGYYFMVEQPRQNITRLEQSPVTPYTSQPAMVYEPFEEVATSPLATAPETASQPVEEPVSGDNTGSITENLEPQAQEDVPRQQDYHASIEQDPQGVTIILSGPQKPTGKTRPEAVSETASEPDPLPGIASKTNADKASVPQTLSPTPEQPRKTVIIHIVVKGDTLWDIAKRYVDDPFLYPQLARLSDIKNPHRIYPGNRVRIIRYLD